MPQGTGTLGRLHHTLYVINFFRKFTVQSLFFLIPLYFLSRGFSGVEIGLSISAYGIAPLIFSIPIGWINDRFSINKLIRFSLLFQALLIYLIGLNARFSFMPFLFLMLGMANNALDVSINSLYYKDGRPLDLNKKYGLYAFWLGLGMAVGTLTGGILAHYFDFIFLFKTYALIMVLLLPATFGLFSGPLARIPLRQYKLALINKKTLMFAAMLFVLATHWGVEGTVYSPLLKEYFGLSRLHLSLFIAVPLLFLAGAGLAAGLKRFDARHNKRLFVAAMAMSGLGHIGLVFPILPVAFLFRLVHETGDGLMGALIAVTISRLFTRESIGGSSGVLLAVMTTGNFFGALIFAPLGFNVGLTIPFIVSGCLLILNAVFALFVFRQLPED
jgi:MFS family permease